MAAYIFFQRLTTTDAAELAKYKENLPSAVGNHSLKILAYGTKHENIEGQPTETAVLVEFPNVEEAKTWYYSDAYTSVRKHRLNGGEHMAVIVEGNPD